MAVCLVTGGAGFIGSHLVNTLIAHGHIVRVLDNISTGSLANLERVLSKIELLRGDLTDPQLLRSAVQGVELIFHQAGVPSVPRSLADPLATHRTSATGTLQLLLAAREAGVRRVIYAASSSVYGNIGKGPRRENNPTHPLSPYAIAKLTGEHYCEAFTLIFGLETVRLRYFSVFGPHQSADGPCPALIPALLKAMLAGQSPTIYGDGLQSRDFTYVDDVVQANVLAAEARRASGKVYNIAFGRRTTVLQVVAQINELLGTRLNPIHDSPRDGEVRHSLADTSLAQMELGFCPCTDLRNGLQRCIDALLAQQEKGENAGADNRSVVRQPHFPSLGKGSSVLPSDP
jgi:UDP-glucose 4-epimerase